MARSSPAQRGERSANVNGINFWEKKPCVSVLLQNSHRETPHGAGQPSPRPASIPATDAPCNDNSSRGGCDARELPCTPKTRRHRQPPLPKSSNLRQRHLGETQGLRARGKELLTPAAFLIAPLSQLPVRKVGGIKRVINRVPKKADVLPPRRGAAAGRERAGARDEHRLIAALT